MIRCDYDEQIERLLASRSIDWKLKEKLRTGETCLACEFFDTTVYCLYDLQDHDYDDDHGPVFLPDEM
jgi:hypothetical protein